jgi:hypothetical protein
MANILALVLSLITTVTALATEHWSGPSLNFTNAGGQTDILISGAVEFRRGITGGIYNVAQENSFNRTTGESPRGTLWAASGLNNPTFTFGKASELGAGLNFTTWTSAYGGPGSLATQILNRPSVVRILGPTTAEDIYLDLTFTQWGQSHAGSFAYTRSTPAPTLHSRQVPAWPIPMAMLAFFLVEGIAVRALQRGRDSRSLS